MADLILSLVTILLALPLVYFSALNLNNIFAILLLIAITIPTIYAMLKGAPFVPTPMKRAEKIVKMAKIKKGQVVYDIGCGDGRFVYIAANKYGAKAIGIELSPLVYLLALIRKLFWRSKAHIKYGDFALYNLKNADIIFCYLLPDTLKKLQPMIDKKIKKGTIIYSYAFQIPNWKLIHTEDRDKESNFAPVFVYQKI